MKKAKLKIKKLKNRKPKTEKKKFLNPKEKQKN